MSEWEPKPGTGWHKRVKDGHVHYGLMLEDGNEYGHVIFVKLLDDDVFRIGYSPGSGEYACPGFAQLQRVELDFSVPGWSVVGVEEFAEGGANVLLRAVRMKP